MGFRVWGSLGEGIKKSTLRQGFNSCVKGSGEPQQVRAFNLAQGPAGGKMEENMETTQAESFHSCLRGTGGVYGQGFRCWVLLVGEGCKTVALEMNM